MEGKVNLTQVYEVGLKENLFFYMKHGYSGKNYLNNSDEDW